MRGSQRYGPLHAGGVQILNGLGLAIAKAIVEQHKGKIYARSEMKEQTTFFVQLPIDRKKGRDRDLGRFVFFQVPSLAST